MRLWLKSGMTVVAIAAAAGLLGAQQRPSAANGAADQIPGIQSLSVETTGSTTALLQVAVSRAPGLPRSFNFPYEDMVVAVNDLGRGGDRRSGDGIYSGPLRFTVAGFERSVRANAARFVQRPSAAPSVGSTRFTPVGSKAPGAGRSRAEQIRAITAGQIAADVGFRETARREVDGALGAFRLPAKERPAEVFRVERQNGILVGRLFGRPVPIGLFIPPQVSPASINPDQSLVVTDLAVVRDPVRTFDPCTNAGNPNGVWTFKHLVTQMANHSQTGVAPEDFVLNWLTLSEFPQEANNFIVQPRPPYVAKVRDAWLAASGGSSLDLDKAPFRLLAIVARPDLGGMPGGYSSGSAGELRFVFGVLDPASTCGMEQSTVIFEYAVPISGCGPVKNWIQSWFKLSDAGVILGSPTYNAKVQALTDQVVIAGANPGQSPNGSAISQIRTNDLIGGPWALFEYRLQSNAMSNPGHLDLVTVKQTPDVTYKQTPARIAELGNWINLNQADLIANRHTVPNTLPVAKPFLGAEAPTANNAGFTWTNTNFPSAVPPVALTNFSVATCNGCHAGDTATAFTHVKPRPPMSPATLSTFMRDPPSQLEDDLERRQRFMADALNSPCFLLPLAQRLPIAFVH